MKFILPRTVSVMAVSMPETACPKVMSPRDTCAARTRSFSERVCRAPRKFHREKAGTISRNSRANSFFRKM